MSLPLEWRDRPYFADGDLDFPRDRPLEESQSIRAQVCQKVEAFLIAVAEKSSGMVISRIPDHSEILAKH